MYDDSSGSDFGSPAAGPRQFAVVSLAISVRGIKSDVCRSVQVTATGVCDIILSAGPCVGIQYNASHDILLYFILLLYHSDCGGGGGGGMMRPWRLLLPVRPIGRD